MYVCMYVCMYVSMYVCMYAHTETSNSVVIRATVAWILCTPERPPSAAPWPSAVPIGSCGLGFGDLNTSWWDGLKNVHSYSLLGLSIHQNATCYPTMTKVSGAPRVEEALAQGFWVEYSGSWAYSGV